MESGPPPPASVLRAFKVSAREQLVPLAGGIAQSAWRAGDVVLKPVQEFNPGEGDWVAEVLDAIVENGFHVVKPVRAVDGRWLEDGWTAWHWIEGEHQWMGWRRVIEAADAFHGALRDAIARRGCAARPAWLDTRRHRWALAEASVWHGAPLPARADYSVPEFAMWERARAAGPPLSAQEAAHSQVVHGDVASNVLVGSDGVPAFIDVSPGWRPASSTRAQIAVEGFVFYGADAWVLGGFSPADLARACAFRLLCGFQAVTVGHSFDPVLDARFGLVLDLIGA